MKIRTKIVDEYACFYLLHISVSYQYIDVKFFHVIAWLLLWK